ncbi:MAG: type II toxin-antitoxin system Phd/YefM family antitoxin [Thermoleophilaceae bacterium]
MTMRSAGIRELRRQASRYLREVERGETIEITNRGQAVAWLVPVPSEGEVAQLRAGGRLERGAGDLLALGDPLEPAPHTPLPSEALAAARTLER